jgi:hypothetical protein
MNPQNSRGLVEAPSGTTFFDNHTKLFGTIFRTIMGLEQLAFSQSIYMSQQKAQGSNSVR